MTQRVAPSTWRRLAPATLSVAFAASIACWSSPPAVASSLYVDGARGDDAVKRAENSATRPWKTLSRATWGGMDPERRLGAEAAQAGDTVYVAAGTYAVQGSNSRNIPAYLSENSGRKGQPIVFKAVGRVVLTLSRGHGSVIGSYQRDYITWDGFTINEAEAPSAADTGPVTIWFCDGCVLENLEIDGNGDDHARMDNHTGVRIEQSKNITVRHSRIRNVFTGSNANNGAGIMVYSSTGLNFEHNEISQCGAGIFLKGGPASNLGLVTVIRRNLIHDIGELDRDEESGNGIVLHAGAIGVKEAPILIYQNVVRDVREAGIKIWMFDGRDPHKNPMHTKIVNNTIDRAKHGLWITGNLLPDSGHTFWNNVVSNVRVSGVEHEGTADALVKSRIDFEHNVFFRAGIIGRLGEDEFGLSGWKRTLKQDAAPPATQTSDPQYLDGPAFDYRLKPTSPARSIGVDVLDLNGNGDKADSIPAGAFMTGDERIGPGRSTAGGR